MLGGYADILGNKDPVDDTLLAGLGLNFKLHFKQGRKMCADPTGHSLAPLNTVLQPKEEGWSGLEWELHWQPGPWATTPQLSPHLEAQQG